MHTHICVVIDIISHHRVIPSPLPEAGLYQNNLDLSPVLPTLNDCPCSYSVVFRDTLASTCALQIFHVLIHIPH